ncbi:major facilitator superfamily-domain-containing protein [Mycena vitilis]|nr:major facilitator superfamily-domain-containing protein [Mycena vitilis]
MSTDLEERETFETDPLVAIFPSPSSSVRRASRGHIASRIGDFAGNAVTEDEPLLGQSAPVRKKPFYRARPLWLVPFAIAAALIRGMTLAPRVTVYTQLSCSRLHLEYNHTTSPLPADPIYYDSTQPASIALFDPITTAGNDESPPSSRCVTDPEVRARVQAARIQTMYSITMGLLSALTTGWWGHFGERHGRTRVLAIASFGWFLTDVTFILASSPSSPLSSYGHILLLIAPVFEGLLGGWSTLQSGTSAYISDCTSSGSRASVFSRFTGVSFLGFSLGPIIGGWLIRHPIAFLSSPPHPGQPGTPSVTSVFWVAAIASFANFCFMLFVMPESVSQEQKDRACGRTVSEIAVAGEQALVTESAAKPRITPLRIIKDLISPLAIFLPVPIFIDGSSRKRKDWSLTLLACAMFGYMLSAGLYQIKYLYGSLVYSWGPEQLSYYISFMGGGRAFFLLFVFPLVISRFKPKSQLPKTPGATKPKPTKVHLAREIKFDLRLTRISLCIDIVANTAIVLAPAPKLHSQEFGASATGSTDAQFRSSQALFVVSSWIASWGAGLVPAVHSLALCIVQARAFLEAGSGSGEDANAPVVVDAGTGKLFGALAVLQAIGQMILGPLLFGLIYSGTVATFPKAVFCTAIGILFLALSATILVRSPLAEAKGKAPVRRRYGPHWQLDAQEEEERGRSRVSKDLRGYGSTSEAGSPPEQGPSSSGWK